MDKSFVGMGVEVCPCCGNKHNEAVLIHKRLGNVFDGLSTTKNFMGWTICGDCQGQIDDDRIGLVVCDDEKSTKMPNGNIQPEGAHRLGEIMWIQKEAFEHIFNTEVGDNKFMFCDEEVPKKLKAMMPKKEES